MVEVLGTALFWFAFVVISGWVLRRCYFQNDKALSGRLRIFALIIEAAVIGLFFFPWLPKTLGGNSGWQIILQGNADMILMSLLILLSFASFCTDNSRLLKIGAVSHIVASLLIFEVMIRLMPGTVQLVLRDTAPIIAIFLMVINTLAVLLLWHQLQKRDKIKTS